MCHKYGLSSWKLLLHAVGYYWIRILQNGLKHMSLYIIFAYCFFYNLCLLPWSKLSAISVVTTNASRGLIIQSSKKWGIFLKMRLEVVLWKAQMKQISEMKGVLSEKERKRETLLSNLARFCNWEALCPISNPSTFVKPGRELNSASGSKSN